MSEFLPAELRAWLQGNALQLDEGQIHPELLLEQLAQSEVFGLGVPTELGGKGGDIRDAVEAIAVVAEYSLTAAFVFWGHRTFIEYIVQSPNSTLAERWLPSLLSGKIAGATGLSNAMKFLSGIESLQITSTLLDTVSHNGQKQWELNGALPWVTNLRPSRSLTAAAVMPAEGHPPLIAILDTENEGVKRSPDLNLIGLKGSNTAAIAINKAIINEDEIIHHDALAFIPKVRPAFLGMQCAMAMGLARAALNSAKNKLAQANVKHVLHTPLQQAEKALEATIAKLLEGLKEGNFEKGAAALFRLRIDLANQVQQAIAYELQASGGAAYLVEKGLDFARRLKESAFIPIITPSVTQLEGELQKQAITSLSASA